MPTRDDPYGAFNFIVDMLGSTGQGPAAGFSEIAGLTSEIGYSEYRNGNDVENEVRHIAGLTRAGEVILRRGVIGDATLYGWFAATRDGAPDPQTILITLLDEARNPVCGWRLTQAQPKRWSGPSLAASRTGLAIEELTLIAQRIDFVTT